MRTIWVLFNIIFWTIVLAGGGLILSIFEWRGKILGQVAHLWSKLILSASGIKYSVEGYENLDDNQHYIFAANHASAYDIPLAFATIKHHTVSLSKIELKWVPIFGWAMQAAKHIFIDRKNRTKAIGSLKNAALSLQKNPRSALVFPEGTRSKDGKLQQFKKGGLLLAIESQLPVAPIALCGTIDTLKNGIWKINPKPLKVIFGKPITTENLSYKDRDMLTKQVQAEVELLKSNCEKNK